MSQTNKHSEFPEHEYKNVFYGVDEEGDDVETVAKYVAKGEVDPLMHAIQILDSDAAAGNPLPMLYMKCHMPESEGGAVRNMVILRREDWDKAMSMGAEASDDDIAALFN